MPKKEIIKTTIGGTAFELHISPRALLSARHEWVTNRHSNVDHELHVVVDGTCSVEVEGVVYDLHAGQAILILPGSFHKPLSHSRDLDRLTLGFFPTAGRLVPDEDTPCIILDLSTTTVALARELMDEYDSPGPFHQKMTRSLLDQLTIRLLRRLGVIEAQVTQTVSVDLRIDVIDGFFADSLADNVTKEDLAARLHLSSRQVNRFLHKRYGMSFREKLFTSRMQHAGWLLRHTRLPVQQIALQVGYTSTPAFIRSFTRFHDRTPQQFREQTGE
ncbi:MAG: helix-turn-helix domain-containing protein [Oscillospiraceae bacterium]|nr:helix-turn-helix domain-containing protein [Oscillospiraceae bacterium]